MTEIAQHEIDRALNALERIADALERLAPPVKTVPADTLYSVPAEAIYGKQPPGLVAKVYTDGLKVSPDEPKDPCQCEAGCQSVPADSPFYCRAKPGPPGEPHELFDYDGKCKHGTPLHTYCYECAKQAIRPNAAKDV